MANKRGFWQWLLGVEPTHPLLKDELAKGETAPASDTALAPLTEPATAERAEGTPLPEERPCAMCGGAAFRWGWLESGLYGTGKGIAAQQPKFVKHKTRFGDFIGLRARLCINCRHVDIFARKDEDEEPEQ